MVRVINNNLWTPVPWGFVCGGHSCGGNNWMQKMFGYQMLFNMMQNIGRCYATPPQQQGGFYPGLYLGGGGGGAAMPQNYEEYLQQQQDAQSLTELKSAYSEFNIRKIGDRYFAYLKSDKTQRVEADTIDELMDGLNEYVDQNPDKFKAKPAKVETSRVDGEEVADTDDADKTADGPDGAGTPPGKETATKKPNAAGRKGAKPPKDWTTVSTWYKGHFTDKNTTANNALALVNEINYAGYTVTFADDNAKKTLADDIVKYNISIFNDDGSIRTDADWSKLDLPNVTGMEKYATVKKTNQQAAATTKPDKSKHYIVRMVAKGYTDNIKKAFAVAPDGTTITLTPNDFAPAADGSRQVNATTMADEIKRRLRNAGFNNVTIRSDGYGINKGATSTDFNADDKKRHYVVTLQCDKSGDRRVYGCYLPDGTFMTITNYQYSAGPNLDNIVRSQAKLSYGWENITCNWDTDTFRTS